MIPEDKVEDLKVQIVGLRKLLGNLQREHLEQREVSSIAEARIEQLQNQLSQSEAERAELGKLLEDESASQDGESPVTADGNTLTEIRPEVNQLRDQVTILENKLSDKDLRFESLKTNANKERQDHLNRLNRTRVEHDTELTKIRTTAKKLLQKKREQQEAELKEKIGERDRQIDKLKSEISVLTTYYQPRSDLEKQLLGEFVEARKEWERKEDIKKKEIRDIRIEVNCGCLGRDDTCARCFGKGTYFTDGYGHVTVS